MKKSQLGSLLTIFLLIPATLFLGTHLKGRWFYLTCTLIIMEVMIPFFLLFESRKPQARELVTIAVMCALSVAARVAVPLPAFKPMTAIIMLTGIALGPEAGFMTGAMSAFASNFFFSQGPWTPWQMMAYGFSGFLAGSIFHKRKERKPVVLAIFGFLAIQFVIGPMLDTCTIFTTASRLSWKFALTVLAAGVAYNLRHALACAVTMLLFSRPLLGKLDRLMVKYGMLDAGGNHG